MFSPWLFIRGINIDIKLTSNPINNNIVNTTARVFLNFKRVVKKRIIGLPINEITPARAM